MFVETLNLVPIPKFDPAADPEQQLEATEWTESGWFHRIVLEYTVLCIMGTNWENASSVQKAWAKWAASQIDNIGQRMRAILRQHGGVFAEKWSKGVLEAAAQVDSSQTTLNSLKESKASLRSLFGRLNRGELLNEEDNKIIEQASEVRQAASISCTESTEEIQEHAVAVRTLRDKLHGNMKETLMQIKEGLLQNRTRAGSSMGLASENGLIYFKERLISTKSFFEFEKSEASQVFIRILENACALWQAWQGLCVFMADDHLEDNGFIEHLTTLSQPYAKLVKDGEVIMQVKDSFPFYMDVEAFLAEFLKEVPLVGTEMCSHIDAFLLKKPDNQSCFKADLKVNLPEKARHDS